VEAALKQRIRQLWPFAAVAAAVGYLIVMLVTGALPQNRQIAQFEAAGLLTESPETVNRIEISLGDRTSSFSRQATGWTTKEGAPVDAVRAATLERALKIMHNSGPVRVMAPEETAGSKQESFGFSGAGLAVTLSGFGGILLRAEFGNKNTDGMLKYLRIKGHGELYLMSGFFGNEWEAAVAAGKN
jgi:hypothetical protein